MVIGVPKELDKKKVQEEVDSFAKTYKLSEQENKELTFIMNTFCKYYNKMSDSSQMFEQKTIIESFEGVLETILDTYNGTGVQTRANLFWKQLPCIMQMLKDSGKSKATAKAASIIEDKIKTAAKPVKQPKRTVSSPVSSGYDSCGGYSPRSYGGCSGSTSSPSSCGSCGGSYSSSGGGCGGGYSYGGHC